jgi:hypothetical protein
MDFTLRQILTTVIRIFVEGFLNGMRDVRVGVAVTSIHWKK